MFYFQFFSFFLQKWKLMGWYFYLIKFCYTKCTQSYTKRKIWLNNNLQILLYAYRKYIINLFYFIHLFYLFIFIFLVICLLLLLLYIIGRQKLLWFFFFKIIKCSENIFYRGWSGRIIGRREEKEELLVCKGPPISTYEYY